MSDAQYSSPEAGRVSMAKWSARDAGDLANGSIQRGQDETIIGEGYKTTQAESAETHTPPR